MTEYEKINTLWKRDMSHNGIIMPGEFSKPEFKIVSNYEFTEKIDGTNIRVIFGKVDELGTCYVIIKGRTEKSQIPEPLLNYLRTAFTVGSLEKVFDLSISKEVILYGEGYGPGIQKGGKYRDDVSFILFDILIDGIWLEGDKVTEYARDLGIGRVPVFMHGTWEDAVEWVLSRPNTMIGKDGTKMEGIVCRSSPLMLDRFGNRVIFKLKLEDYDHYDRVWSKMHYEEKDTK